MDNVNETPQVRPVAPTLETEQTPRPTLEVPPVSTEPVYDPDEGRRLWEEQQRQKQAALQQPGVVHVGHNGGELPADSGRGTGELSGTSSAQSASADVTGGAGYRIEGAGRIEHHHAESDAGAGNRHQQNAEDPVARLDNAHGQPAIAAQPTARVEPSPTVAPAASAQTLPQQEPQASQHLHQAAPSVATTQAADAPFVEPPQVQAGSILDDTGSQLLEFSPVEQSDPVMLYSDDRLGGWMSHLSDVDKMIVKFMKTLSRDDEGRILFKTEEEEAIYMQIQRFRGLVAPQYSTNEQAQMGAQKREGVTWSNSLDVGEGVKINIQRHPNATKGILGAIYRRNNSGAPVTMWLPATGIYIESEAPHESDICDYDMAQTMETSKVGMSSYGLLLSASSGLYIKHMFNFALRFVTSATVDVGENDLHQTLSVLIDERDYWLVVVNCLIAKFPGGIPWQLSCASHECQHEETVKLNIGRSVRYGNGILTPVQNEMARRQRTGAMMTLQEVDEYQKAHVDSEISIFKDEEITVKFRHSPVAVFLDTAEEWVADINRATTEALGQYPTENERDKHIRVNAEARRLLRYAHMVEFIAGFDPDGKPVSERDPVKIREALSQLSSDRRYVVRFEEAVERFNEGTRLAVFGYMARKCPSCGHMAGEEDGPYRGIVPISPDRLFFVLSRVVYEIQKLLADRFADIG